MSARCTVGLCGARADRLDDLIGGMRWTDGRRPRSDSLERTGDRSANASLARLLSTVAYGNNNDRQVHIRCERPFNLVVCAW